MESVVCMNRRVLTTLPPGELKADEHDHGQVNWRRPVMMAGPAGTGKTQLVFGMLSRQNPQVRETFTDRHYMMIADLTSGW
jgi:hypothetical protein